MIGVTMPAMTKLLLAALLTTCACSCLDQPLPAECADAGRLAVTLTCPGRQSIAVYMRIEGGAVDVSLVTALPFGQAMDVDVSAAVSLDGTCRVDASVGYYDVVLHGVERGGTISGEGSTAGAVRCTATLRGRGYPRQ